MSYQAKGIFHGTGEIDTGKTTWALGAYPLRDTAYIYDDVKKFSIEGLSAEQVRSQFGFFLDLTERYPVQKFKELEFAQAVMAEVDKLPAGKFQSIVFDTWTRFGKALRRYVKANPLKFREAEAFTNQIAIRHAEEWGQASVVEKNYIASLARKSEALFLITHIKKISKANVETEAFEPDCGKAFDTACNMRLWFRRNPNSGVPVILVLKRLAKVGLDESGMIRPTNLLPRKITPRLEEQSVWDCINRYWLEPVGNREPTEDEKPTELELSILDKTLTKEQKEIWQAELREKQRQEKEEQEFLSNRYQEMQSLALSLANGKSGPPPMIAAQILSDVQKEYPETSLEEIANMLKKE